MSGAMTVPTWIAPIVRVIVWLCLYLILAIGRCQFERWLIAWFQHRRHQQRRYSARAAFVTLTTLLYGRTCTDTSVGVRPSHGLSPERMPSLRRTVLQAVAVVTALLSGAVIPLAPDVQVGHWRQQMHLFGNAQTALLYVLALEWISAGSLILAEHSAVRQPGRPATGPVTAAQSAATAWHTGSLLLLDALPVILLVLSLVVTTGMLDPQQEGRLSLTAIVALKRNRLAVLQPLAMLLWLICAAPLRPGSQTRVTGAWQVQALNRALLTSTLFWGGWQGPLVARYTWLGLPYTAIKVGIATGLWSWAWASLPPHGPIVRARTVWRVFVPMAAINLLITSMVVAFGCPLSAL